MKLSEDVSNRMLDKEVKKMESFDGRTDRRIRASGIEMLKIFAIFLLLSVMLCRHWRNLKEYIALI